MWTYLCLTVTKMFRGSIITGLSAERWWKQCLSLHQLLLSQPLMLVLQGWQVSVARSPGLWLEAPGEFHAHPFLVFHWFCHFPLLSIRAPSSPRGVAVRQTIVRAVGCGEKCAASLPASQPIHQHGGHQRPLSRVCLGKMPQVQVRPPCFATQNAHGCEAERQMKPLGNRSS